MTRQRTKASPDPLKWFVAVVLLSLVAYQVYSGLALAKVGIPGLFEVEFADAARPDAPGCAELDEAVAATLDALLAAERQAIARGDYETAELADAEYWETIRAELVNRGFERGDVATLNNRDLLQSARRECLSR